MIVVQIKLFLNQNTSEQGISEGENYYCIKSLFMAI